MWWWFLILGIVWTVLGMHILAVVVDPGCCWASPNWCSAGGPVHSWQRSLFTLLTVVGVWAILCRLNEIRPPSPRARPAAG
jgi:hypothetical protein